MEPRQGPGFSCFSVVTAPAQRVASAGDLVRRWLRYAAKQVSPRPVRPANERGVKGAW